jgi:DNA-binding SARP family transcriptional activator
MNGVAVVPVARRLRGRAGVVRSPYAGNVGDVDLVDVAVLGLLRVGRVPPPTARQQRLVFAALAESAPRSVSPSRLIEGLWGDDAPEDSVKALQVVVARLRRAIRASGVDIVFGDGG